MEILRAGPPILADKTLTGGGLLMVAIVVLATAIFLLIFAHHEKNWFKHYLSIAVGVFIFEIFIHTSSVAYVV